MTLMRMPSPEKVKRLAGLAQQAQNRSMIHLQHSHVGNNHEHIRKLMATTPELGQAAKQLGASKPMRIRRQFVDDEAGKDDTLRAHKAMKKATAFSKAAKGLVQPKGKRMTKMGGMGYNSGKGTQATPRVGAYR